MLTVAVVGVVIVLVALFGLPRMQWGWSTRSAVGRRAGASLITLTMGAAVVLVGGGAANAAIVPTVPLLTAANYAVLGGSTVTNTGNSTLGGSLGLWPGTSITGFPPGLVLAPGTTDNSNAAAQQAQADLTAAYLNAAGRSVDATTTADLANLTLQPGVYAGPGPGKGALSLTGPLVLDAAGDPNAVFIFQTDSTLVTESGSTVTLINGAQECNVFWQVGSSATLGTGSIFAGSILALSSITVTTGVTVHGRALARNAAVTLDNDTFTVPTCELRRNSVSVTKSVKPASLRNWSVDFTISPDPGDGPTTKTATKATPTVSWGNLVPSTLYTVTETTPTGWLNGAMTCSTAITPTDGPARAPHPRQAAPPGQASFTPSGNPVTCTVENIAPPRVLVQKRTIGDFGGPFQFEVGNGALVPLTFGTVGITTTEADLYQPVIPEEIVVALGPVTVSETVVPLGFEPDTMVCNQFDADGVTVALNNDVANVDGELSISVASMAQGHELRCVATNRKQELPATGADPFELTAFGLILVGAGAISHRLARRRRPARA